MQSPDASFNGEQPQEVFLQSPEVIEIEPKFTQLQEDLLFMFEIKVTSETSLRYPWVKDEFYTKVVEGLTNDEYFALDYMVNEKLHGEGEPLLNQEDLLSRGIRTLQNHGRNILHKYKEPRLSRVKELFIVSGIFTELEIERELATPPLLH